MHVSFLLLYTILISSLGTNLEHFYFFLQALLLPQSLAQVTSGNIIPCRNILMSHSLSWLVS
jgi:hypothetical protein